MADLTCSRCGSEDIRSRIATTDNSKRSSNRLIGSKLPKREHYCNDCGHVEASTQG